MSPEIQQLYQEYNSLLDQQQFIEEDIDYTLLEQHIEKLKLLNVVENSAISVFDLYKKEHVYISSRFTNLLGFDINEAYAQGNTYFDERIHPDDFVDLLKKGIQLTKFFLNMSKEELKENNFKFVNEYRILNKNNQYVRIIEQHLLLAFDKHFNVWLALSISDLSPYQDTTTGVVSRIINIKNGSSFPVPDYDETPVLSKREKEILSLVKEGKPSKEIADVLFISVHTVNTHRQRILEKLKVSNSMEAIQYAHKTGII